MVNLLEKNAYRLATLEETWEALGAVRTFEFHLGFNGSDHHDQRLPAQEHARRLTVFAINAGCKCVASGLDQYGTIYVTVSKKLRPAADEVTALQELLEQFVQDLPGSFSRGWGYPAKREVNFWPDCWRSNQQAASNRAAVLFGDELVGDPARYKTADHTHPRFEIVPSKFLRLAESRPPADPQATASSFAQWVYSLYGAADGDAKDLERGKSAEPEIWERRRGAASCNDNRFLRDINSPWELVHNGLHMQDQNPYVFELQQLRVRGVPMKVSPDLLYLNRRDAKAVIVEIKNSHLPLTKNLWPNIWAQLWCYSHIDVAAQASNVTVVGEVWSDTWTRPRGKGRKHVPSQRLVSLRASVKRDPRAPAFDRFFSALFEIYGGARQRD